MLISCLLYYLLKYVLVILSAFLCKKKKKRLSVLHLYLQGFLLPLSLSFSSLFSLEPLLRASILFFRQSSFHPRSVWCPPVGSAFYHPACSQETPVAPGRPAVSLITHVTRTRLGERESICGNPSYPQRRRGERERFSPPAGLLSKRLTVHRELTLSGLYDMVHCNAEPHV